MKVPGNEGVGEHVRTRSHSGLWPRWNCGSLGETRTERRKLVSSAGSVRRSELLTKDDPAVWPDVSPTPSFRRPEPSDFNPGLVWRAGIKPPAIFQRSKLTSSSWRPCGSSSQSSSLRSSPSSPSSLSWPCCPP